MTSGPVVSVATHRALGGARVACALLGTAAVARQLAHGSQRESFESANFFSFFTVQSNVFAALILFVSGVAAWRGRPAPDFLRGAATLYMTTTGVVYVLLLRGLEESLQTPLPWVNAVLHYVMPAVLVVDWLADGGRSISFGRALVWLAYPLLYVAYSLIRGAAVDWYPYPFLDPREDGYGVVGAVSIAIALAMATLSWLIARRTRAEW